MTVENFGTIVKGLKAVYTDPTFIPDKFSFDMWYGLLGDADYDVLSVAARKYILTNKRPPTIADLRGEIVNVADTSVPDLTSEEAWSLVYKAVCNGTYGAEEEFSMLPESIQKTIVSPNYLRELASMDSDTVSSVEKSLFVRSYSAYTARKKDEAKIGPVTLEKIAEMKKVISERTPQLEERCTTR